MAPRLQARDSVTGEARIIEVGADEQLVVLDAEGSVPLAKSSNTIEKELGGQFRLQDNSIRGWGTIGTVDDTATQNLGTPGQANLSRNAGGLVYPYAVNVLRMFAWHRNSNAAALAWGWVMFSQEKTAGSNSRTTTYILDEVTANGGTGPRDYQNNTNQLTDIDLSGVAAAQNIPAGHVIGLGVSAPTADPANYNVQIEGGYIQLERA